MIDILVIFILAIFVMILGGIIYSCDECGKLFSVRRISHQGCKRIVCKHCGKEK